MTSPSACRVSSFRATSLDCLAVVRAHSRPDSSLSAIEVFMLQARSLLPHRLHPPSNCTEGTGKRCAFLSVQ